MACLRDEIKHLDMEINEERSDSLITHCDESEWGTNNVPIDHTTQPATSVLLMNSYFDFVYAKALYEVKKLTMKKSCYGCEINHPSQRHHDCLMEWDNTDDDEYRLDFYFEDMVKEVDEATILQAWEDIVRISNISPEVIDLHKMVISTSDFLAVMKTEAWFKKMKRMMLAITRIENRLFR